MIIRKNRKVLLTAAAILGGTVTTSVHADEISIMDERSGDVTSGAIFLVIMYLSLYNKKVMV